MNLLLLLLTCTCPPDFLQSLVSAFSSVGRYFRLRSGRDYLFIHDSNLLGAKLDSDDDEVTAGWLRDNAAILKLREEAEWAQDQQQTQTTAATPATIARAEAGGFRGSPITPGGDFLLPGPPAISWPGPPPVGFPWIRRLAEEGRQAASWVLYHHEPNAWVRLFYAMAELLRACAMSHPGGPPLEGDIFSMLPVEFRPHIGEAQGAVAQHPWSWEGVRRFLLDNLEPGCMLALGVPRGPMGPYGELMNAIDGPFGRSTEEAICMIRDWAIAYRF